MVSLNVGDMGSEIVQKVGDFGKDISWLTGTGGFVWGVTNDITYSGGTQPAITIQRVSDTLARVTGLQVNLGGGSMKSSQTQQLNWGNLLNNATYAAVGVWFLKEISANKYIRAIYNVTIAPLVGYGVGKVFDDVPFTNSNKSSSGTPGWVSYGNSNGAVRVNGLSISYGNPNYQRSLKTAGGAPFAGRRTG